MSNLLVCKSFSLDFAHALDGYDGLCKNIHGHTYHLSVSILGKISDLEKDVKIGMVVDFSILKNIINKRIISLFDHSLVLNGTSEKHVHYSNELKNDFERIILLDRQPTCENLLLDFKKRIENDLRENNLLLYQIKLQETPSSYAEWNIHINEIKIPQ